MTGKLSSITTGSNHPKAAVEVTKNPGAIQITGAAIFQLFPNVLHRQTDGKLVA